MEAKLTSIIQREIGKAVYEFLRLEMCDKISVDIVDENTVIVSKQPLEELIREPIETRSEKIWKELEKY